jgi:phage terminase large subunit-like protein
MVQCRQGYAALSPPLKEVKRLLAEGTAEAPMLRHGGNPLARWMIDNLAVAMDPAGNVKPDKAKAGDKIDGVSALVTAMARAMFHQPPKISAYESGDLEVL